MVGSARSVALCVLVDGLDADSEYLAADVRKIIFVTMEIILCLSTHWIIVGSLRMESGMIRSMLFLLAFTMTPSISFSEGGRSAKVYTANVVDNRVSSNGVLVEFICIPLNRRPDQGGEYFDDSISVYIAGDYFSDISSAKFVRKKSGRVSSMVPILISKNNRDDEYIGLMNDFFVTMQLERARREVDFLRIEMMDVGVVIEVPLSGLECKQ
ncbi:MAG: hypothetical protein ACK4SX_13250 [Alcanivoracaceae bacterium]